MMQIPQLYLGLIGFDEASERAVRAFLRSHAKQVLADQGATVGRQVLWTVADFQEADALLIYGLTAVSGAGDRVRYQAMPSSPAHQAPLGVQLSEIAQPFAISHPGHLKALGVDVKNYPIFDLTVPSSLPVTLRQFEAILRPLRSLFALAVEITTRRDKLQSDHTYHLENAGRVDVILDLTAHAVMLRPGTRISDLARATWHKRPKSANFAPAQFLRCSTSELMWLYAMHCREPELPRRYTSKPIYFHHLPDVRSSLLQPRHAALFDLLSTSPQTLEQLQLALPGHARWLVRDVYALYLLRAVSTSGLANDPMAAPSVPSDGESSRAKGILSRMNVQQTRTMMGDLEPLHFGDTNVTPE